MNDHSPIPVTENDYNQYFQALKNLESVAFFGVYGIKKNALGNLERANSSQTPGFLSFLMQLIQSLWSKKVVETNRRTTEQITTSDDLNRDVDLVTAMNQRIKGIADKELSRDSKWHLREENYYGWQVMRLYNSRLVSIQAWNEYVEPQSIYSKIRVALEKALGYYVSSLKSIGDGTPLTTTTQFKADSEKTNRFFKITEKMHQDRISGKLDIHRATHVLQLMGGVFLRKDMIDTTARLANPAASHQLGNIGRVLYDNPFLNPYSLLEYLETLRSMYRLEGGELVEIDNPTPSLFTIGAGPDSLMGVFETMGKSSQYEMTRCFLAAKTIKHHFHTEKGYLLEVRIVEEVIRYIKKHCESMAWDISLSEIWQWSQEINAIFSGADAYSGRNQDTNVREYAIGKFYLDVVDKIIENKPDEGKELFRFSLSALKNKYSQPTMINKLIEHYKKQCEYKNWAISSKELDLIYREIIELFDDPNDIPDKIFEKFYKEIAHELFKKKINNNKREKFLDVSFRYLNSTASAEHLKWLYGDLELYIHKNSISQTGKVDSENTLKLAIQEFLSRIKQVIQHSDEAGKNQLIKSVKEALKSISKEDLIELNLRH